MSKSTFTVPVKKETPQSVIKVIRRGKGKQEPSLPTFDPPVVITPNVQPKNVQHSAMVDDGASKSRDQAKEVTGNKSQKQMSSSPQNKPPCNPSRKTPIRPEKPESAFLRFTKKRALILEAKGATNGYEQASQCWQKLSPALIFANSFLRKPQNVTARIKSDLRIPQPHYQRLYHLHQLHSFM